MSEQAIHLIRVQIPSCPDRLRLVRSVVRCAALMQGCDEELADRIVLAINEACMNIIQHGYAYDEDGKIIVDIYGPEAAIEFRITDFAQPIDADRCQPRKLDELRPGGLGMHLITSVMDNIDFKPGPEGKGNVLELLKRIGEPKE